MRSEQIYFLDVDAPLIADALAKLDKVNDILWRSEFGTSGIMGYTADTMIALRREKKISQSGIGFILDDIRRMKNQILAGETKFDNNERWAKKFDEAAEIVQAAALLFDQAVADMRLKSTTPIRDYSSFVANRGSDAKHFDFAHSLYVGQFPPVAGEITLDWIDVFMWRDMGEFSRIERWSARGITGAINLPEVERACRAGFAVSNPDVQELLNEYPYFFEVWMPIVRRCVEKGLLPLSNSR